METYKLNVNVIGSDRKFYKGEELEYLYTVNETAYLKDLIGNFLILTRDEFKKYGEVVENSLHNFCAELVLKLEKEMYVSIISHLDEEEKEELLKKIVNHIVVHTDTARSLATLDIRSFAENGIKDFLEKDTYLVEYSYTAVCSLGRYHVYSNREVSEIRDAINSLKEKLIRENFDIEVKLL